MRTFRLITVSFIFTVVFAIAASAQNQSKIALIDTGTFYDEKEGITKIISSYKKLQVEFAPRQKEIDTGAAKLESLQKEIQTLQDRIKDPNNKVPVPRETLQAKADEYDRLKRELTYKGEDAKSAYNKREAAELGPIVQDVGKQMAEFAKQKGYTLVLDVGKLYDSRVILYWDDAVDITKEFVTFYNARPAGTATTAKPE